MKANRREYPKWIESSAAKEMESFSAFLSMPGAGKTTAAAYLLPKLMATDPKKLSRQLRDALNKLPPVLREALTVTSEYHMLYKYDFSLPGNNFSGDDWYDLDAAAAMGLRMLYELLGGCTPDFKRKPVSFTGFLHWIRAQPHSDLLFLLTPETVEGIARTAWRNKDDPKANGLLVFVLDESHIVNNNNIQQKGTRGVSHFQGMLDAHWKFEESSDLPVLLLVAGTHLNFTLSGDVRGAAASGHSFPFLIPLETVTQAGALKIMHNLLVRLGGQPNKRADDLLGLCADLSEACPRALECLLVAAARKFQQLRPDRVDELIKELNLPPLSEEDRQSDNTKSRTRVSPVLLRLVLEYGHELTATVFEATIDLAVHLLMGKAPSLGTYIDSDQHLFVGRAIIMAQTMQKHVRRVDAVLPNNDTLTWADLESVGLVAMVPVDPKKRARNAASQYCTPRMPYILYVYWSQKLKADGNKANVGSEMLKSDIKLTMQSRDTELANLCQMRVQNFVQRCLNGLATNGQ